MPQAIGDLQLAGWHFAANYWGIPISRVAFWRKLLGDCNFEAPICRVLLCLKLSGSANLRAVGSISLVGELQFARAFPVHHVSETRPLTWRLRFMIYRKHAACFGDYGSSYSLSTPPHVAILLHHIS